MLAYHNKQEVKAEYLARVTAHRDADEIVKGKYWESGKGCAVGCTIHGSDHSAYERELGLPFWLARLEDRIFEGMSNDKAKEFPVRFLEAISVGADVAKVRNKFLLWLLVDIDHGVIKYANADGKIGIQEVADLLLKELSGEDVDYTEARSKCRKAYAAAAAAYAAAAADAAYAAAAYAAAAAAAADAAYAAAAAAADAAYAAYAYAADARTISYNRMAEKLLELLSQCEVQ